VRASAYKFAQKLIGEGGVRLLAILFYFILARRLGAEAFGLYSSALAYASLSVILVDLGTNAILIREIARRPKDRLHIVQSSHALKIVASFLALVLLWVFVLAIGLPPNIRFLTLCLGVFSVGQALTDYFCALLSGIEEMGWEAFLKTLFRAISVFFGIVPLSMGLPLSSIGASMAGGTLVGYAASLIIIHNRFPGALRLSADFTFIKGLIKTSMPVFASVLFWVLYESQDVLLLNFFKTSQVDIGYFSSAIKIIDVLRIYPVLLIGVFFPALSKLHVADEAAYEAKKRRLFLFILTSVACLSAMLFIGADWVILGIYREGFMPAARLLQTLAPALLLSGLNYTQMQFLIVQNRERALLGSAALVCLSNIAFAIWFIPLFGPLGACYALLASESCAFLYLLWLSRG
jgi:O-antigen/teichoic acid export membrane protein